MTKNICIYHANCVDGVGAAFAVWYHQEKMGKEFDFIPASYGKHWIQVIKDYENDDYSLKNSECWIVDFSFPKEQLLEMADVFNTVIVLDHHKSAKEDCETIVAPPNLDIVFDMERSGAGIAWDYCSDEPRPHVINLIEDRDLWNFYYKESKAIHMQLGDYRKSTPLTESDFIAFGRLCEPIVLNEHVRIGTAKLDYHNARIEEVSRTAVDTEWKIYNNLDTHEYNDYKVKLINCPYFMASDMGEFFRDQCDIACMYNIDLENETVAISLRSKEVDVAAIAKEYFNGGGHHNAAGGWLPMYEFFGDWTRV